MNTMSESPAETGASQASPRQALIWDLPVRVFHWTMAVCFAGAYLTSESERLRLVHTTLGYTMAGLVVFRLVWGLVGTPHARFRNFMQGPAAVIRYLGSMMRGRPEHYTGHNPAGAVAIAGMLMLAVLVAASGWATYNDFGGEWLEELHEAAANTMLAVVLIHIAGVVVGSLLHGENLVRAMFTGRKAARQHEGIRSAHRGIAALLLAAVLGFWWLQWSDAPAGDLSGPVNAARNEHDRHDDDD